MAQAKNYKGAMAKLNEAEAAKSTPDDTTVINQLKQCYRGVLGRRLHPGGRQGQVRQ